MSLPCTISVKSSTKKKHSRTFLLSKNVSLHYCIMFLLLKYKQQLKIPYILLFYYTLRSDRCSQLWFLILGVVHVKCCQGRFTIKK